MADGAATKGFPLFGHTPGNPQLPTIPATTDPKDGLESLFVTGNSITAQRFPEQYLEVLGGAPGVALGFARTWLNGLSINPVPLDFTNITAPKQRSTTLHNSFRTSITVTAVDLSALGGVTLLTPGLPVVIPPFSSQIFNFEAALIGSPAFDDEAIFETSIGDFPVRMLGRRVLIISLFPQQGIRERVSWLTDGMTSDDGTEQMMALRRAPRSSVNIVLRYDDELARARLMNLLLGAIYLPVGGQLWYQSREVTSAALTTDTVIQVNTENMEIEVDGLLSFVLPDLSSLEGEVQSFTASAVTLTQAIGTALPLNTSVMPIKFGYLNQKVTIGDWPVTLQEFKMMFELIDYSEDANVDPAYFGTHPVDGLPILLDCPFIDSASRKSSIESATGRLDGQTGQIRQTRSEALSRPVMPVLIHCRTLADQHAWRRFLHSLRGSWGAFYVPTGSRDLPLSADFTLGSNTFTVTTMGLESLVQNVAPRRDVRVTIAGVSYDRRITNVNDDGSNETITLNSVIPGGGSVPKEEVKVEWLTLSRIVGDTATFKHKHRGIAELRFQTRGVIDGV